MKAVTAAEARALLHCGAECALLDLREAGEFGEGHALFAIPLPYSRMELRIRQLVPRRDTPLILMDGGNCIADRAADLLAASGYTDIRVVSGGVPAWAAAGYPLYQGVNVPSKTLGELAEAVWHPQMLSAERLAAWQADGEEIAFFDTRPPDEYAKMRVPGARCLPNGELAHRLGHLPADAAIVLTCAGRTRGIIGAIGLQVAGHAGPVCALENGTQGWTLAGKTLERGNQVDALPPLDPAAQQLSQTRAKAVTTRYNIPRLDGAAAAKMLADPTRNTYLFDLRHADEASTDPLPAAERVYGGQLVQATDQWVGVRRARLILACDGGLRSALAAFWLLQLGYQPHVVAVDDALRAIAPAPDAIAPLPRRAGRIAAADALAALRAGALLVDLRPSRAFRHEHVAGAVWSIRPCLGTLGKLNDRSVMLIADSHEIANLAAAELAALGARRVDWVEGGHKALIAAGAPRVHGDPRPADRDAIDHLFFVHDRHDGNLDACRRYLAWETGLVVQLDAQERAEFALVEPP